MWIRFPLEKQIHDKWCWAAVTAAVERYFNPASEVNQCKVASALLGIDCCSDGESCNKVAALQDALVKFNRLDGDPTNFAMGFSEVKQSIDAGIPVCVRIGWHGGGGHFVLISGYRITSSRRHLLEISDPLFPNSIIAYDDFMSSYQNAEQPGGGGFWSHTFKVK